MNGVVDILSVDALDHAAQFWALVSSKCGAESIGQTINGFPILKAGNKYLALVRVPLSTKLCLAISDAFKEIGWLRHANRSDINSIERVSKASQLFHIVFDEGDGSTILRVLEYPLVASLWSEFESDIVALANRVRLHLDHECRRIGHAPK